MGLSGDDSRACRKVWKFKTLKRWQEFKDMARDQTDSSIYNGVAGSRADMVDANDTAKQASSDTADKK